MQTATLLPADNTPCNDCKPGEHTIRDTLFNLLQNAQITTLFQPILDLRDGQISGYEALSRGPAETPLHLPHSLFKIAHEYHVTHLLDQVCFRAALTTFTALDLPGRLFANLSPASLIHNLFTPALILSELERVQFERHRLVIEITEITPHFDYQALRAAVKLLHCTGINTAIDDLGEGFSSLRLWSELQPKFVKIDKHFIAGIDQDANKLQFVRSITAIAENSHTQLIAEGIETIKEQKVLHDLGIPYGQGYFINPPSTTPDRFPSAKALHYLKQAKISLFPQSANKPCTPLRAEALLIKAPAMSVDMLSNDVLEVFLQHPDLDSVAVLKEGKPVGMINRLLLLNRFLGRYARELYGRFPCTLIMDPAPLIIEQDMQLQDVSDKVIRRGKQAFTAGFVITKNGRYRGIGSGFDLMREITHLQITNARYANPLTGLPGNVPIQEHIIRLLTGGEAFVAAYADLNQFKPYNDIYGFRRGDDMISLTCHLLTQAIDPQLDFIGHVGGDDFILLFQSKYWELNCHQAVERFNQERLRLFNPAHITANGYIAENRQGHREFHPLVSLSIGAVIIDPQRFHQYHAVAQAMASAKHMAKRLEQGGLFIDRRRLSTAAT